MMPSYVCTTLAFYAERMGQNPGQCPMTVAFTWSTTIFYLLSRHTRFSLLWGLLHSFLGASGSRARHFCTYDDATNTVYLHDNSRSK